MARTPDQVIADNTGIAIDAQISALNAERAELVAGPARILEIDASLAILAVEKARIDPRRSPANAVKIP